MNIPVLILTILIFLNSFSVLGQEDFTHNIDSYIKKVIQDNQLPGLAIAIVEGDSIVFAKGYGVRMIGDTDPMNEHTLFQNASITKSFTAILMGMLFDQGKINWDDPVKKHILNFTLKESYITENLTILDVLVMRTGIVEGDTLIASDRKELIQLLANQPISDGFRSSQTSWNLSYTMAGYIEEIIEQKLWVEILEKRLLEPLEMSETYLNIPTAQRSTNNLATPHIVSNNIIKPISWTDFELWAPSDALISNVMDLSKFIQLILYKGKYKDHTLINAQTLNYMIKPQIIAEDFFTDIFNPKTNFMAFGLVCKRLQRI
jgi:CubicO group peptidase (beta-lactamase class C family)